MKSVCSFCLMLMLTICIASGADAKILDGYSLIASYPLSSNANDATGKNGPINLTNTSFNSGGISCNGKYLGDTEKGCDATTPAIADFNYDSFAVSVTFKMGEKFSERRPVIVCGTSWRWLFIFFDPDGKVGFGVNDYFGTSDASNKKCNTDTWYTATVIYDGKTNTGKLYIDDAQVQSYTEPLNHSKDNNVTITHWGDGTVFKGLLKDLKIYSGSGASTGIDNDGDGYTQQQGDCNDNNKTIHPNAIDICGDGIDQDCDGKDEACMATPSAPAGVAASDGTVSGKVRVEWTAAANAASYDVYRADMPAWTGTAPKRVKTSVTGMTYDDETAVSGSRYYYWVKTKNSGGASKYSNFDGGYWGTKGSIPTIPGNVDASDGTVFGKVSISWDAVDGALVYEIWRADIPAFLGGKLKKIGTADTAAYDDTTIVEGNRYYYWVKARNSWGVSRYSKFNTGYTGAAASVLSAPTGVAATDGTVSGKVTITWDAVTGAALYEVWRAEKLVSDGGKPVRAGSLTGTSYDDTAGAAGTTYYYWVKSRDSWGASKYSTPDTGYHNKNFPD